VKFKFDEYQQQIEEKISSRGNSMDNSKKIEENEAQVTDEKIDQ
jgi:hypothetical protein